MAKGKNSIFGKKEQKDENMQDPKVQEETGVTENMSDQELKSENITPEEPAKEADQPSAGSNKEEELQAQVKDLQDKYLRMMAEFDNFRKRSLKERTDLIKSAGEDILVNILPVMDDFERGLQMMETSTDGEAIKSGVQLIYNKFKDFLTSRGVKEIDAKSKEFNVDEHEAITKIPAPEEGLKGKVVDVIQKGYFLNEKVIRYSKVVVGE